jgi:hypothetical protein
VIALFLRRQAAAAEDHGRHLAAGEAHGGRRHAPADPECRQEGADHRPLRRSDEVEERHVNQLVRAAPGEGGRGPAEKADAEAGIELDQKIGRGEREGDEAVALSAQCFHRAPLFGRSRHAVPPQAATRMRMRLLTNG